MPLHTIHRPENLDDLVGNESASESLRSVLSRESDIPHSFLFTGPAGTGKTTGARILKNELGCTNSDFHLYNSSNTRGIDTVREIIDSCQFAPMHGDVKMIVLEECHQLTGPAQEALLVILEEPPEYVYFVLCTTEPDKLKKSLKRRCHISEMKALSLPEIKKLLLSTLEKENIEDYPKEILDKIAEACDGSPGKALNLLDTVIDIADNSVALKAVEDATVSESNIAEIARMLLSGKGQWSDIAQKIKGLAGEPESLRYAFLGYLNAVLLNKGSANVAALMMPFMEPCMYTGKAGLTFAIYMAWSDTKK